MQCWKEPIAEEPITLKCGRKIAYCEHGVKTVNPLSFFAVPALADVTSRRPFRASSRSTPFVLLPSTDRDTVVRTPTRDEPTATGPETSKSSWTTWSWTGPASWLTRREPLTLQRSARLPPNELPQLPLCVRWLPSPAPHPPIGGSRSGEGQPKELQSEI